MNATKHTAAIAEARAALAVIVGNQPFKVAGVAIIPWRNATVRAAAMTLATAFALQLDDGMAVFVA